MTYLPFFDIFTAVLGSSIVDKSEVGDLILLNFIKIESAEESLFPAESRVNRPEIFHRG